MNADLGGYLAGGWTVERTAHDRRAGTRHTMTGTACYATTADGLAYRESVRWTVNGRTFDAHRAYTLVPIGPWQAEVYFDDGRFFHALDLRPGHAEVVHDCPPDRYAGWYVLDDGDTHRTGWSITGPRKDIALATTYRRGGNQPQSGRSSASSSVSSARTTKSP